MNYRNFAFISYSHRDMKIARWLQSHLERFRLPTEIHNDVEAGSRYLRPVFRDQTDLNAGVLSSELRRNLEESKYLIILCSGNSANSQWVNDEVRAFVEMGRLEYIIPVLIEDGDERVLFPAYLSSMFKEDRNKELLAVNLCADGKEKALVKVVARMLGVSFDSLWQRHRRRKRIVTSVSAISALAVMTVLYVFAFPVYLTVQVSSEHCGLPQPDRLFMSIGGANYNASTADTIFHGLKLPGFYRLRPLPVKLEAPFCRPVDMELQLGLGLNESISVTMLRDDAFAIFAGIVTDENLEPVADAMFTVKGMSVPTAQDGSFEIHLDLDSQKEWQDVSISKPGYRTVFMEEETPGASLHYILHKE